MSTPVSELSRFAQTHPDSIQSWLYRQPKSQMAVPTVQHNHYEWNISPDVNRVLGLLVLATILTVTRISPSQQAELPIPEVAASDSAQGSKEPRPLYPKGYTTRSGELLRMHLQRQIESESSTGEYKNIFDVVTTPTVRLQITGSEPTIVRNFPDKTFGQRVVDESKNGGYYFQVLPPYNDQYDKSYWEKTVLPGGFSTFVVVKDNESDTISVWAVLPKENPQQSTLLFEPHNRFQSPNYFCVYDEGLENPHLARIFGEDFQSPTGTSEFSIDALLLNGIPQIDLPNPPTRYNN